MKQSRINYLKAKDEFRDEAIQFLIDFDKHYFSYGELADYQNYFEKYAKRYGLVKEFRENGII